MHGMTLAAAHRARARIAALPACWAAGALRARCACLAAAQRPDRRALHPGHRRRHPRAHAGAAARRALEGRRRHRQPCRRDRQHRHRVRREGRRRTATRCSSWPPSFGMTPAIYQKLPFDPVKSFAPVVLIATSALGLVVHPQLPVKSAREFIQLAKRRPGAAALFLAGQRRAAASHDGAVQARDRHRHRARAVQGPRRRDHRPDGRARAGDDLGAADRRPRTSPAAGCACSR